MTRYQIILLVVLAIWPFAILGLLFLMSKLETYVQRIDAQTPAEAGLEPVSGSTGEREVKIFVGDQAVGETK